MISKLSCLCVFDFPFQSICIIRGRELTEICHLSHEKQLITMNTPQDRMTLKLQPQEEGEERQHLKTPIHS